MDQEVYLQCVLLTEHEGLRLAVSGRCTWTGLPDPMGSLFLD